jgi:cell division septum initiation protein DivIVA
LWGFALLSTSILFLTPLIYKTNKELIDHHIANASNVVNQQTEKVKQLASHHATRATDVTKQYVGDYSAKAQEMIGNARARSTSPVASAKPAKVDSKGNTPAYKSEDFPAAPKEDFKAAPPVQDTASALKSETEPLIAT